MTTNRAKIAGLMTGTVAAMLAATSLATPAMAATPAAHEDTTPAQSSASAKPSTATVEHALTRLGLPATQRDGTYDSATLRRGVCAWRTVEDLPASRNLPTATESREIVDTTALSHAQGNLHNGVDVSITCQAAFWVENGHIVRVMDATTGKPGHDTRLGSYRIFESYNTWRNSTIYKGARMYKPMQFDGGEALHGSATDALVKTYPASHGCVRMLHRDIDALHAGGVGVGTWVTVFGHYTPAV